jgi:uncharacterized protein (TIGR00725 family)
VCGAGRADRDEVAFAREVGRLVARADAVLVCGGLGGVMEAAVQGAHAEDGVTIGILPGSDRTGAAPGLTAAIPTGLGEARNALVVRAADALIAIGGEFGTLSEIALALKLGVPVVGWSTWELHRRGARVDAFPLAPNPGEAVRIALEAAREAV